MQKDISAVSLSPLLNQASRRLSIGAIAGPVLGVIAWIVLGATRPGYLPLRQLISDLGLGTTASFMNASFVLSGLLLLVGIVGISFRLLGNVGNIQRWICTVLLALSPLGYIVIGFFTETAVAGHTIGSLLIFLTPVISFLVTGLLIRRSTLTRTIGNWLLVASPLTLVLFVLFFSTGVPGSLLATTGLAGLAERVMIIEIHAWYMILGWLAFRFS